MQNVHFLITDRCFAAVVSVEPTYSYYEKVSEELEKIVHEVKEKEEVEALTDGRKWLLFAVVWKSQQFWNVFKKMTWIIWILAAALIKENL